MRSEPENDEDAAREKAIGEGAAGYVCDDETEGSLEEVRASRAVCWPSSNPLDSNPLRSIRPESLFLPTSSRWSSPLPSRLRAMFCCSCPSPTSNRHQHLTHRCNCPQSTRSLWHRSLRSARPHSRWRWTLMNQRDRARGSVQGRCHVIQHGMSRKPSGCLP